MKFAIVDGSKTEASKGAAGICPSCGSELIAKCGVVKINHWAHKRISICDRWWESETEWHRAWKNKFPDHWQEISLPDELTGERHIADVRTEHGLVIEFQHSHIDHEERDARERFYKNMVWVVDGTRLKRDYVRFLEGWQKDFRSTLKKWIYFVYIPGKWFPVGWTTSSVPVIFDFLGAESVTDPADKRRALYCLFPGRLGKESVLAVMSRGAFITNTSNGEWQALTNNFVDWVGRISSGKEKPVTKEPKKVVFIRRGPQYFFERGRWRKHRPL
ncbi:MAG TPA: competence protein CoiA family protein [Cyclobacteriaceae bacterium]|nr:competence protein CoiA family protein [Cyclobacteriaceae bacterium]